MRFITILVVTFGCHLALYAQIPVEVMAGHRQIQHEFFFFKDLDKKQKVSIFTFARFAVDYRNSENNSSFISSQLTYNITSNWGISSGGTYALERFAPIVAVSYSYANKKGDLFLNIFPTVILDTAISHELFGLVFYTPKINEKWSLFTQLIFGTNFNENFSIHQFSYQQVRLGFGFKDWFQFGLGTDLNLAPNETGTNTLTHNTGLFIRKEF